MVASIEQIHLHRFCSASLLLSSIPTYLITRYMVTAPFGRHVSTTKSPWWYGPKINPRLSWFIFECPNLIWSWYWCWHRNDDSILFLESSGDENLIPSNTLLICMFALHYVNRAIVYPLRMSPNSQSVPLVVTTSAVIFTAFNGYIQCFYLGHIEKLAPLDLSRHGGLSRNNIQKLLGIFIFVVGMGINIYADGVLRDLRSKNNDKADTTSNRRYYIPRDLVFTYISCPNFTGEIIEWFGYAMASQFSLPSVAFFCYTASNLIPRGVAHHNWYKRKFEDYPMERKWAVIPFIA
ncbi:hypothetical protein HJC23_007204 [Cyclotella cryptica]|uniref:3-oxo-5-alpha-steroid 4-dehydrogenase C-terminal domain-containing protein n=1 Tax=Cyclotella cryptica TaxID=29204 RepID=A0ABD3QQV8_9STRA